MKRLRTERQESVMWKIFGHTEVYKCPECERRESMQYLGLAHQYSPGLHAKIYQCRDCQTWVDVIWEQYQRASQ